MSLFGIFIFKCAIEMGLTLESTYSVDNIDLYQQDYNLSYIEFYPEIYFLEWLRIYGKARVDMYNTSEDNQKINFNPVHLSSLFGFELLLDNVEIGFKHLCVHPIIAWNEINFSEQYINKAYNQIYVRIQIEEE